MAAADRAEGGQVEPVLLECSGWGVADAILGVIEPPGTYPGQERQGQPSQAMGCTWSVRSTSPWCYLAARRISNLEPPLGVGRIRIGRCSFCPKNPRPSHLPRSVA